MENNFNAKEILIYTDGSCHTQKRIGAWVAILLFEGEKIMLQGNETNTSHNRMELMAVIKAIEYVGNNMNQDIVMRIFTDSQYVMGLQAREGKLVADNFITQKGKELRNPDLLKIFFKLLASHVVHFNKIKAHQKKGYTINYNIVADKLSRSMVRAITN